MYDHPHLTCPIIRAYLAGACVAAAGLALLSWRANKSLAGSGAGLTPESIAAARALARRITDEAPHGGSYVQ